MIPTRSPGSRPLSLSSPATRAAPSSSCAYGTTASSSLSAGRSPCCAAVSVSRFARLPMAENLPLQRIVDARRGHRRPVVVDRVREQHEVAQAAALVAHVVAQESLGGEAERAEHRDGALLLGDDLDVELAQSAVQRLRQRPARERAPEPVAAVPRVDDQAHLPHVVRPAGQPDDGDVPDDLPVLDREAAAAALLPEPRLHRRPVEHLLLEERPLALGHAREELHQRVQVLRARRADHSASLWSTIHSTMPGRVTLAAARPATSPTWPASSWSSSAPPPSSCGIGSAAGRGAAGARLASTVSAGERVRERAAALPSITPIAPA